jgi:hypothetical protein
MAGADADGAKVKTKKTRTVKKTVTKKVVVKKGAGADPAKPTKPKSVSTTIKKAVKAKSSPSKKVKATKPKAAKATTPKIAKEAKVAKPRGSSQANKFETYAIEAVTVFATEEKPYVSASKIRQYLVDYDDTAVPLIRRNTKRALDILVVKKILKAKKDSYAFTTKGKALAPAKVQARKKVVRVVKPAPSKAELPPTKVTITLSGRATRPIVRST